MLAEPSRLPRHLPGLRKVSLRPSCTGGTLLTDFQYADGSWTSRYHLTPQPSLRWTSHASKTPRSSLNNATVDRWKRQLAHIASVSCTKTTNEYWGRLCYVCRYLLWTQDERPLTRYRQSPACLPVLRYTHPFSGVMPQHGVMSSTTAASSQSAG
jgi:hypothetical protein